MEARIDAAVAEMDVSSSCAADPVGGVGVGGASSVGVGGASVAAAGEGTAAYPVGWLLANYSGLSLDCIKSQAAVSSARAKRVGKLTVASDPLVPMMTPRE